MAFRVSQFRGAVPSNLSQHSSLYLIGFSNVITVHQNEYFIAKLMSALSRSQWIPALNFGNEFTNESVELFEKTHP
jgi:hypothetical protein